MACSIFAHAQQNNSDSQTGDYFGLKAPLTTPEVFAPGIISVDTTIEHGYPAFSPDLKDVFWQSNYRIDGKETQIYCYHMQQENGVWRGPEIIPDASGPAFAVDGNRVFYNSNAENGTIRSILKQGNSWDEPEILGLISQFPELKYAYNLSFTDDGTLYFLGYAEGLGSMNDFGIFRSVLMEGIYQKPELLPEPVNIGDGTLNWTPFIAPDESYLLFSSSRQTSERDMGDIFICFRKSDGSWSKAYNLGKEINSERQERFPAVSPDGKYLFFTRWTERGNEDVMWVKSTVIDELGKEEALASAKIRQVPFAPINEKIKTLYQKLKEVAKIDSARYVGMCNDALQEFDDDHLRYNLLFWELSFHYAGMGEYQRCLDILGKGHEEGLFYLLRTDSRIFPPYLNELKTLDGFESFLSKNKELKEKANEQTMVEYMVQLPSNYSEKKKYPMLLLMHGGIGTISALQHNYDIDKLRNEFIVVYTQGDNLLGSYSRSYNYTNWKNEIYAVYHQIVSNYAVDTSEVLLGGPSAGGYRTLIAGLEDIIPTKGLILSFPVYPRDSDSALFVEAAKKGIRVSLICGENDWAIKQQKKLGYILDQHDISNRFVVLPDEGHGFPENWSHYLDTSIEYIFRED